jgi:hypothetical protein
MLFAQIGETHMSNKDNVYQARGFENRRAYLESLAEDFGIDRLTVFVVASALGKSEDFDGLVSELNGISLREDV